MSNDTLPDGPSGPSASDPAGAMPDAAPGPLAGQVTLANHGFSMPAIGSLYTIPGALEWTDCDFVLIDYLTDAQSAAAFLPEQATTVPIPDLAEYSPIKQIWAHYRDSTVGPYDELIVLIPCLYRGELYVYCPLIYVTTDQAMASGREVGGYPKKIADISMEQFGDQWLLSFSRGGERLVSGSMKTGPKLFSTPLPADEPVDLPAPYNLTMPLPPPTGTPQDNFPFPVLTLRLFRQVGTDDQAPALAQLIAAPWRVSGDVYSGSDATLAYYPSDNDPFHKLPVLQMIGAAYAYGQMRLALKEAKVLEDLLSARPVRAAEQSGARAS